MGLQLTWEFEKYLSASASPTIQKKMGEIVINYRKSWENFGQSTL